MILDAKPSGLTMHSVTRGDLNFNPELTTRATTRGGYVINREAAELLFPLARMSNCESVRFVNMTKFKIMLAGSRWRMKKYRIYGCMRRAGIGP